MFQDLKYRKLVSALVSCSILATHRDGFLSKIIAIHLEFFVLLQRSVEEDNDIHLSGLKGAREKLNELKTAIELAATSPICWQSIMTIIINCCCCRLKSWDIWKFEMQLTGVVAAIKSIETSFNVQRNSHTTWIP
jgi:hypothetical protein